MALVSHACGRDSHSRMVSDINVTLRLISFFLVFLASVFDPASPVADHLMMAGNITGRHLAGTVLMGSPVAELIYFLIRLVKNHWHILLCLFPYKDIQNMSSV